MGNRIRELRKKKGVSASELAEKIGTTVSQLHRLETGARQLTVGWMQRLARALDVRPIELIEAAIAAEYATDIVAVDPNRAGPYAVALSMKNLTLYEVVSHSMSRAGFAPRDRAIIDAAVTDFANVTAGAIVVVAITAAETRSTCLRYFLPPALLVSNGPERSDVLNFEAEPVSIALLGVVIQRIPSGDGNGHNHT